MDSNRFCFAWYGALSKEGANRAGMLKAAQWPEKSRISVSFLDGDPALKARVEQAARIWVAPGLARLGFEFRTDTNDTNIRISFRNNGSWSRIGTSCKELKDLSRPTMNFGWLTPESSDVAVQSVVLHEFGHALGLIHEHQVPAGGIQWNKEQVYNDLSGPPNNWDKATIDFNMFFAWDAAETNFTAIDPTSIMMYEFPKKWTLNGFSTGFNTELSATDKKFIKKMYP